MAEWILFNNIEPHGLVPGCQLASVKDLEWFEGVCKVTVHHTPGDINSQGTGFLFRFETARQEEVKEIFGFLTCDHVLYYDVTNDEKKLASPEEIFLDFEGGDHFEKLSDIRETGSEPLRSLQNDIYFMQFSDAFRSDLERRNAHFFRGMGLNNEQHVIIPQYPGGQRSLAYAMFANTWIPDQRHTFTLHNVSTQCGSSGSPLLQVHMGERGVIGMHHGLWTGTAQNVATPIAYITQVLNDLLQGRAPISPLPSKHVSIGFGSDAGMIPISILSASHPNS